jgi:hypothetical protein
MPDGQRCYIDFASGDQAAYDTELAAYNGLSRWLAANGASYGLPTELGELDEVGRETLASVYEGAAGVSPALIEPDLVPSLD